MDYRHTQLGPAFFRVGVLVFLAAIAAISAAAGEPAAVLVVVAVGAIVGAALLVFSRLTVVVSDDELIASFGWGWPRRRLPWDGTTGARVVRNRWWYGFGIRWFPGGTLWNVWGLDAVEFDLVNERQLRIGTDEPDALLAALVGKVPIL